MDGDKIEGEFKQESGDPLSDNSNIFQSFGIRRFVRYSDEVDRVLLGYGFNFLPSFGIIFWLIFLIF
jgi:hypothetical protein